MSLSGQYLEELSRRYKKQVEEMQRAVNRTLAAVAEESRKGEEREQKHIERTAALQKQLATLTVTLEVLLSERESWQHKAAVSSSCHVKGVHSSTAWCILVLQVKDMDSRYGR
jgi:seryl-tRNA synthetase